MLQKADLRGYQSVKGKYNDDVVVLVHKSEGRLFLTDRNGFYNDFLADAWVKTKGNVIIILTANRTAVGAD